jgi:hypothetical protein
MGRKRGTSQSELVFRHQLAITLSRLIGAKRGACSEAAKSLEITKQSLSLYLREKATPGAEILQRICRHWNLTISEDGKLVPQDQGARQKPKLQAAPYQPTLFEALSGVLDKKLQVSVMKRGEQSIDLKVSINF